MAWLGQLAQPVHMRVLWGQGIAASLFTAMAVALTAAKHVRSLTSGVFAGRLGEGRGIWVVVEGLHGRPREREQRDRGRTCVVHLWCTATGRAEVSPAVSGVAVALRAAASQARAVQ